VTEGYYELETTERRAKLECLTKHQDLVVRHGSYAGIEGKW
jgi:hypothetical protein